MRSAVHRVSERVSLAVIAAFSLFLWGIIVSVVAVSTTAENNSTIVKNTWALPVDAVAGPTIFTADAPAPPPQPSTPTQVAADRDAPSAAVGGTTTPVHHARHRPRHIRHQDYAHASPALGIASPGGAVSLQPQRLANANRGYGGGAYGPSPYSSTGE